MRPRPKLPAGLEPRVQAFIPVHHPDLLVLKCTHCESWAGQATDQIPIWAHICSDKVWVAVVGWEEVLYALTD